MAARTARSRVSSKRLALLRAKFDDGTSETLVLEGQRPAERERGCRLLTLPTCKRDCRCKTRFGELVNLAHPLGSLWLGNLPAMVSHQRRGRADTDRHLFLFNASHPAYNALQKKGGKDKERVMILEGSAIALTKGGEPQPYHSP